MIRVSAVTIAATLALATGASAATVHLGPQQIADSTEPYCCDSAITGVNVRGFFYGPRHGGGWLSARSIIGVVASTGSSIVLSRMDAVLNGDPSRAPGGVLSMNWRPFTATIEQPYRNDPLTWRFTSKPFSGGVQFTARQGNQVVTWWFDSNNDFPGGH